MTCTPNDRTRPAANSGCSRVRRVTAATIGSRTVRPALSPEGGAPSRSGLIVRRRLRLPYPFRHPCMSTLHPAALMFRPPKKFITSASRNDSIPARGPSCPLLQPARAGDVIGPSWLLCPWRVLFPRFRDLGGYPPRFRTPHLGGTSRIEALRVNWAHNTAATSLAVPWRFVALRPSRAYETTKRTPTEPSSTLGRKTAPAGGVRYRRVVRRPRVMNATEQQTIRSIACAYHWKLQTIISRL